MTALVIAAALAASVGLYGLAYLAGRLHRRLLARGVS